MNKAFYGDMKRVCASQTAYGHQNKCKAWSVTYYNAAKLAKIK
ncbi:hypothetical protein [Nonomuraea sp. NPDC049400]